jgi:hypothetical protein
LQDIRAEQELEQAAMRMQQLEAELRSVHEQLRERTLQLEVQSGSLKIAKSNFQTLTQQAELIKTLSVRCETFVRLTPCRLYAPSSTGPTGQRVCVALM